jgi:hypothetical protein
MHAEGRCARPTVFGPQHDGLEVRMLHTGPLRARSRRTGRLRKSQSHGNTLLLVVVLVGVVAGVVRRLLGGSCYMRLSG